MCCKSPKSLEEVKDQYNRISDIWSDKDLWHKYTHEYIENFISNIAKTYIGISMQILNLGSGGNNHCFDENNILHVDIAENKITNMKKFLVSDIQKIKELDTCFDVIICVGSVLNYCDPLLAIREIKRLSKPQTIIIIEFESSSSIEFLNTDAYNASSKLISSFYQNNEERLWVYSEKFIDNILLNYNFKQVRKKYFHIISPLIYKIGKNSDFASRFAQLDKIFQYIPFLRKKSSNIIICAVNSCPR